VSIQSPGKLNGHFRHCGDFLVDVECAAIEREASFMRTNHVSLIALLLCFTVADVFVAPAFVQGTGQIEGVVRDEQGGVLPGATLSLRNADSGVTRTVTSESDGRYV